MGKVRITTVYKNVEMWNRDADMAILGWWQIRCWKQHKPITTTQPPTLDGYYEREGLVMREHDGGPALDTIDYDDFYAFVAAADLHPWPGGYTLSPRAAALADRLGGR